MIFNHFLNSVDMKEEVTPGPVSWTQNVSCTGTNAAQSMQLWLDDHTLVSKEINRTADFYRIEVQ